MGKKKYGSKKQKNNSYSAYLLKFFKLSLFNILGSKRVLFSWNESKKILFGLYFFLRNFGLGG